MNGFVFRMRWFFAFLLFSQSLFSRSTEDIQYLFPVPDSERLPVGTPIIVRFQGIDPDGLANPTSFIEVSGDSSGRMHGETVVSTDGRTLLFRPVRFSPGEIVTVRLCPMKEGRREAFLDSVFQFTVSPNADSPHAYRKPTFREEQAASRLLPLRREGNGWDPTVLNGISVPSDFPFVGITIVDNPGFGAIFLNAWSQNSYSLILDNDGNPIWYLPGTDKQANFRVQPNGSLTVNTWENEESVVYAFDSTYTLLKTYRAPPGYELDFHEFILLPNGHSWMIVSDAQIVDMSLRVSGGRPNATVVANHIVEMDAGDNPVFIWRSWDHFNIEDAAFEDLTGAQIDYVHMNSLAFDVDGNLLVSSRHLSEITKIDRRTGRILWRLGGIHDDFSWINDEDHISYQHTIQALPDSRYLIFDNGNHHEVAYSRALELALDTTAWTATKVWEYPGTQEIYTWAEGNSQRLENGNTLINWSEGELPKLTEVRSDGSKAFELNFINESRSYRTLRFPWRGKALVPFLVAEPHSDHVTLIFNKFGDPGVAAYRVYGGTDPHPKEIMATTTEPFLHLTDLENYTRYRFRITAVDGSGAESGFSNEEEVFVRFVFPGENMVRNGDFSNGFENWEFEVESADAAYAVTEGGELRFCITEGGTDPSRVRALHSNLPLNRGESYLFEYDAYAEQDRLFEAEVIKTGSPFLNYSKIGYAWLTTTRRHFAHEFVMGEHPESNAQIVLDAGGSNHDVFVDNVSLKQMITRVDEDFASLPNRYSLGNNYPNPFNESTIIEYAVPESSHVRITVYDARGKIVHELTDLPHEPGSHRISFDASMACSGVYFCEMEARAVEGASRYQAVKKMIVLK